MNSLRPRRRASHVLLRSGLVLLLLVAGNETTTNLIGNALQCFLEYPHVVSHLPVDSALLPAAIEEVLRYRSPVRTMFRVATQDVRMDGTTIRKGDPVLAWIGSANRDEAKFADPARFDIRRSPNPHIAFGHGIHQCLGAPLARLEGRIAIEAPLPRGKDFHREEGHDPLEPLPSLIVQGIRHLRMIFEPEAA